jgi:tRNA pseudouridine55 synthase
MFINLEQGSVICIDKPVGWTSYDVIRKLTFILKRLYGKRLKIGHAGTLDPLASGLLILCTGKETKNIDKYVGSEKTYTGIIRLGKTTPSYDLETDFDGDFDFSHIKIEDIRKACKHFTGVILQSPPVYSAIKVEGKRAYKAARKGKQLEMKEREVHIKRFDVIRVEGSDIHFEVECGKGTYIRSLAHDFGKYLGSGSHLASLRRTRVGEFLIEGALSPDECADRLRSESEMSNRYS